MNIEKQFHWDIQQAYIKRLCELGMNQKYIHQEINAGRMDNDIMAELIKWYIQVSKMKVDES